MANEKIAKVLSERLNKYNAIVIAEDASLYMAGAVCLVQELTKGLKPIYIARTARELQVIHLELVNGNINAFFIMDNNFKRELNEPLGRDLIKKLAIEHNCIMLTNEDADEFKNELYLVLDKVEFEFSI